jgi:polyvinyl alcohol dehydrogenase (cytochrome)
MHLFTILAAAALLFAVTPSALRAQPAAEGAQLGGGKPIFPQNQGAPNFQQHCAACHTAAGMEIGGRIALSTTALRELTAERVYAALTTGTMAPNATGLSDPQRRELAAYVTGKRFTDTSSYAIEKMANRCSSNPPLGNLAATPSWNGWSATPGNARFQPAAAAGLEASEVPRLKLAWAFGFPGGSGTTSQPTVAFGRIFVASDNGYLYAIDASTGCGYWSYGPQAAGAYAPLVGEITGHPGTKYAVYGVARGLAVFALDAQTGKELWRTRIEGGGGNRGAATLADGRIYVPLTGTETMVGANGPNCCTSRGAVVAIDANTGKLIWRADTIQTPLVKVGEKDGKPVVGPSGASVWNSPTVDRKRHRIYVGTGNSYGPVAAATSDSVVALDMDDGKLLWHYQAVANDAFMLNCPDRNPDGGNCPAVLGPDWDFGGSSVILQTLPDGKDILVAAGKAGLAVGLDADTGKLLWRTPLYADKPPTADGLVVFGGTADGKRVYYGMQQPHGGLAAVELATGKIDWNVKLDADGRGQIGPASGIPGVVFTGGWDGVLRAIDAQGKTVWRFDSKRPYETVNKVGADGGSFGSAGPIVASGMLIVTSGYVGMQAGSAGNVLLAFKAK